MMLIFIQCVSVLNPWQAVNQITTSFNELSKKFSLDFFIRSAYSNFVPTMDENLQQRFLKKKLEDLLNECTKPIPTIICEQEPQDLLEKVRRHSMFSKRMVPYRVKHHLTIVSEKLDIQRKSIDYGDLYILLRIC